jgi:tetratricopeptide (TPR) repeat protein
VDGAGGWLYDDSGMGATGLIAMRARAGGRVSTMAAGLMLVACFWLAMPSGALGADRGPAQGEQVDYGDYQRGLRHFYAEEYEEALPYFVRAKDEAAARGGFGSSGHATALNNLGELYRQLERFDEAEPLFREALAIDEARLGPDDQGLAKPLNNLALVQRARGDHVEAERNLKRSLHILEDSLGRRHPDVAGSLNNLARLYETTGFPERAQPLLERALTIARDTLGEAHPTTRRVASNLDRVTATLVGAAPDLAPGVATAALAERLPLPAPLVLPSSPELPVPAARPTAAADASPERALAPEAEQAPVPASRPTASPEPAVIAAIPAAAPRDDTREPMADAIEPAAANGSLNGAEGGTATASLLPQARPPGLRWPRLPAGGYALHLASVRDPVSATEEWQRLAGVLPLPSAIHQIEPQRVETAEREVYYRVLGGPFRTSEAAAAACRPVLAKGEFCGVVADGD